MTEPRKQIDVRSIVDEIHKRHPRSTVHVAYWAGGCTVSFDGNRTDWIGVAEPLLGGPRDGDLGHYSEQFSPPPLAEPSPETGSGDAPQGVVRTGHILRVLETRDSPFELGQRLMFIGCCGDGMAYWCVQDPETAEFHWGWDPSRFEADWHD